MKYLKAALPHLLALAIFATISAIFFAPQYSGKTLRQGDMVQVKGMEQDIVEHIDAHGEHPQWEGRMFGGMPAYLINMDYDGRWIKQASDFTYIIGQPASLIFIAMASFYLMLLMFGINPWIAIVGGIAYGLSTYFPIIIEAGHITKMMALAWIPAVVGSVYYAYNKNWLLGAALAGIFLSIEISTSHPQITYYFGFVILALFINEAVRTYREKIWKKFAITTTALLTVMVLAVGSNAIQLYYVASHTAETTRGPSELTRTDNIANATSGLDKDYATMWSYGKAESFNLFIPNFEGGSSSGGFAQDGEVAKSLTAYQAADQAPYLPGYHGTQEGTSGPVYIGAVMIFLMIFGLFVVRGRSKWWIVAVSILALSLAWGRNMMWLTNLMLDHFPMYNKFRTVSMILVVLEWSIPLMAIFALQKLWSREVDDKTFNRALKYSLSIAGGFAILAAMLLPSLIDFSTPSDAAMKLPAEVESAMWTERASMLRADALRSLLFVLLTAVTIWAFYKQKIKAVVMVVAIGLLVLVDLYNVDRRYVKLEDFKPAQIAKAITPTAANVEILQDKGDYRVANFAEGNPFSEANTSYFHRSIGGYHAAKLRRYQDVIEHHLAKNNMAVYDMLNTRYFITDKGVQINDKAAGSAWFVPEIRWVDTPDQEIDELGKNFDPHTIAIVDRRYYTTTLEQKPQVDSTAHIELTEYRVNNLKYKYTAPKGGVVVFSEIYYPKGWTARIDGVEAPYFRANYILRVMSVPAGEHTIEWHFAAPHYKALVATTRASSAILILLALVGITLTIRRKNG